MIEKIITGSLETNSYIISNQGKCIIVDPGLDFKLYVESIKAKYEVVAIFLTHGHVDHIDGIGYFDVPIYIHKKEKAFLNDKTLSLYNAFGMGPSYDYNKLKLVEVDDNQLIELIGYSFKVLHTPGHTRGSVCYYFNDKLISGDTLFCNSAGRTDFPTGDMLSLRFSLKRLATLPEHTVVYPGHEAKTTIKNEKRYNPLMD